PFYTGNCINTAQANYNGSHPYASCIDIGTYRRKTMPVGSFPANPFGLYDMHGNVWEWTCSAWSRLYDGKEKICDNQSGNHVLRGGSWRDLPHYLRSSYRLDVSDEDLNRGFRIVVAGDNL
ncbi:hypothetical protein TI03_06865, partial [Achromatium sp. WMS1]